MNKPYLIQRCNTRFKPFNKVQNKKITEYLKFHYVGSSEFEYGELQTCFRRFYSNRNEYSTKIFKSGNNKFFVYAKSNHKEIIAILRKMSLEELKEPAHIIFLLKSGNIRLPTGYKDVNEDFWIDIENDVAISMHPYGINQFIKSVKLTVEQQQEYLDYSKRKRTQ